MDTWRILRPIMIDWYSEFENIENINETRNQAAHSDLKKVKYKGRSPFDDPDCLCQIYLDVWTIKQSISKFFDHMTKSSYLIRAYHKKYGEIGIPKDVVDEIDN